MSAVALANGLRGAQVPRVEARPQWSSSTGPEAVELAASAGLHLYPWQQHVVDVVLAEDETGRWAAFEAACIVPRQNGKGACIEALILADLFLLQTPLVLYSAHLFTTTSETIARLVALIEGSDHLSRRVSRIRRAAGSESIEMRSGARLRFLARSSTSGRGFTSGRNYMDEAQVLSSQAMAAIVPTLSTAQNPQLVYFGTAPLPDSDYWRTIRARGHGPDDARGRLAFLEWSAPDDAAADDRTAWQAANPSLGYGITETYVSDEYHALPAVEFGRERLGIVPTSDTSLAIAPAVWSAAQDPESTIAAEAGCVFAVDVAPGGRSASIAVAGARPDGSLHVELVSRVDGTSGLVGECQRLAHRWNATVVADPAGPAGAIAAELAAAGVPTRSVGGRDMAAASAGFVDGLTAGAVRVRPHPMLDAAAAAARPKPVGDGAWRWTRRDTSTDISPVVAACLAVWAATTKPVIDLTTSVW